jgi:hypothetical protein
MTTTARDDQFAADPNVWNGEGLPPVGAECELLRGKEWVPVEITGKGKRVTVFRRLCNHGLEEITEADATEFRPIRSEEDRLVEQALKDISAEPDEYGADSVVYRMIKAGYRKTGGDA